MIIAGVEQDTVGNVVHQSTVARELTFKVAFLIKHALAQMFWESYKVVWSLFSLLLSNECLNTTIVTSRALIWQIPEDDLWKL